MIPQIDIMTCDQLSIAIVRSWRTAYAPAIKSMRRRYALPISGAALLLIVDREVDAVAEAEDAVGDWLRELPEGCAVADWQPADECGCPGDCCGHAYGYSLHASRCGDGLWMVAVQTHRNH